MLGVAASCRMVLENGEETDEKAVSPVIGVILIVAITVILGAVVGTAALGFGDRVEENVQAGATVEFNQQDNTFTVNWVSGGNADYLNVSLSGDFGYDESGSDGPVTLRSVGSKATFGEGSSGGDSMKVTGDVQQYEGGNLETIESVMLSDDISDGDEIRVTVVASNGESETSVLTKEGDF